MSTHSLIAVVKQDCPTCTLIAPVLRQIGKRDDSLAVYTQDNPDFPTGIANLIDDTGLEHSYRLNIETVPTLLRFENGREVARTVGWHRGDWESVSELSPLGADLPESRPGCGSKSIEPGIAEKLAVQFGETELAARRIEVGALEDEIETCFERGWSDGLPVVPPTEERIMRMLSGTTRSPDELVGIVPPNYNKCTVEKVAINAVLAGCKPEYLPVVLAAVETALTEAFCMHGLLATTFFAGPMIVVNGPITREIGMNARVNALGQGNRANATIGRALQLVIRNIGGGVPGGIDRAMLGNPGKYTFCFAEREDDSPWESLAVERGFCTRRIHSLALCSQRRHPHHGSGIPRSRRALPILRRLPQSRRPSQTRKQPATRTRHIARTHPPICRRRLVKNPIPRHTKSVPPTPRRRTALRRGRHP